MSLQHEMRHRQLGVFNHKCALCQFCGREAIERGTADKLRLTLELYERLLGGSKPDSEPSTAGTQ